MGHGHKSDTVTKDTFASALPRPATEAVYELIIRLFNDLGVDKQHATAGVGKLLGSILVNENVSETDYHEIMDMIWLDGMELKAQREGREAHAPKQPEEIKVPLSERKTV